jgi:ketosteroid isomerase-like protein
MKVTKAKGLNTDLTGSSVDNPRDKVVQLNRSLAAGAPHSRKSGRELNRRCSWFLATAAGQIV